MSFLRDRKDKSHLSKGRMYFDGLRQRAETVKNLPKDINHRLGLNYNIICILERLERIRELFTNNETTLKPLLKDVHESNVFIAIQENVITLQEVLDEITSLQNYLIETMKKCLIHIETLPFMDKEEFEKSDNIDYIHDIYISTLNELAVERCLKDVSLLAESKDKKELMESIQALQKRIAEYKEKKKLKSDDEDSDSDWTEDEFESDEEFAEFKEIDIHDDVPHDDISPIPSPLPLEIKKENSPTLNSAPEQKSIEDKPILRKAEPPPMQSYSIWCKLGTVLLTTASGIGIGIGIGFRMGGWGVPIGIIVGAVIGFIAGLRLIWAKDPCCSLKKPKTPMMNHLEKPPIKFFPEYGKLNEAEKIRSAEGRNFSLTKSI